MEKLVMVIGLGGTGLETIRNLRRTIVENAELDDFKNVGFLYLDTVWCPPLSRQIFD